MSNSKNLMLGRCPNCGAAGEIGTVCEYCGASKFLSNNISETAPSVRDTTVENEEFKDNYDEFEEEYNAIRLVAEYFDTAKAALPYKDCRIYRLLTHRIAVFYKSDGAFPLYGLLDYKDGQVILDPEYASIIKKGSFVEATKKGHENVVTIQYSIESKEVKILHQMHGGNDKSKSVGCFGFVIALLVSSISLLLVIV